MPPDIEAQETQPRGTSFPVTQHRAGEGRGLDLRQTGTGLYIPRGKVNKELMVKADGEVTYTQAVFKQHPHFQGSRDLPFQTTFPRHFLQGANEVGCLFRPQ